MMPGISVLPARSTWVVVAPTSFMASTLVPASTIRPSRTASASTCSTSLPARVRMSPPLYRVSALAPADCAGSLRLQAATSTTVRIVASNALIAAPGRRGLVGLSSVRFCAMSINPCNGFARVCTTRHLRFYQAQKGPEPWLVLVFPSMPIATGRPKKKGSPQSKLWVWPAKASCAPTETATTLA